MNEKPIDYYSNIRSEMCAFIKCKPQRVLEIGCGIGEFKQNFSKDTEYWGVEPYLIAAQKASQSLTKIFNDTYENCEDKIPEEYFDLIVCNDVIEHMKDPKKFLLNIRRKLTHTGAMIVSIPNLRNAVVLFDLLIKGNFKYTTAGILDYTHLHLFTEKSFAEMATECGWVVEISKPLPPAPFKPLKNFILNLAKFFIPEIKSEQIGFRLVLHK